MLHEQLRQEATAAEGNVANDGKAGDRRITRENLERVELYWNRRVAAMRADSEDIHAWTRGDICERFAPRA